MKRITSTTVLKKNNIEYKPFNIKGVVYWTHDAPITNKEYYISGGKVCQFNNTGYDGVNFNKIVAQTQAILEGIPVINIGNYVNDLSNQYFQNLRDQSPIIPEEARWPYKLGFQAGFNQYQYTQKDIEKAIHFARESSIREDIPEIDYYHTLTQILSQVDAISYIEVDDNFQILEYDYN